MNKQFTFQGWKIMCCLFLSTLFFSFQLDAQSAIATRNVTNTVSCSDGSSYGFYIDFDGENPLHTFSWASFSEYNDGTATLIGTIQNNSNSDIKFNVDVTFSGRIFSAPAGSPKAHVCENPSADDWYYYTSTTGTLTGVGASWGTNITFTEIGPAFQVGHGANQTNNGTNFGGSGWLSAQIVSQNSWGPVLTLPDATSTQNADINIDLSGVPLTNPGGCSNVTSAGVIAGTQTICSGDAAMTITSTSMPSGGTGSLEFIWLSSTSSCPGSVSQSIAGATSATYEPGVLTQTTYFRRCSRRSGCTSWVGESNCITVTVDTDPTCGNTCDNVTSAGGIAGTQTICSGDAAMTITSTSMPSGGTGSLEFIWLSSTSSCPGSVSQSIAGATSATYEPGVLTQTTYFRRCSRRSGCTSWVGESNCITVTVDTDPTCGNTCDNVTSAGGIAGTQTICSGDAAMTITSTSMPSGGTGSLEFIWLSSTSSCPGSVSQSIAGATSATYEPGVLTQTTYFRRCSRRSGCSAWLGESNCITVTVDTDPTCGNTCDNVDNGGTISGAQTICSGETAATITSTSAPSGGSGAIEYLWLSSTTACPTSLSQQITGANAATYSPGTLTQTTYFVRCSRRAGCNSWTIGESNCVTVTVNNSANCGGNPNCSNISVSAANNAIVVGGTGGAPVVSIQVFTQPSWSTYYSCSNNCDTPTSTIPAVPGDYLVYVKYYTASWSLICEESVAVTVTNGGGCIDADNDGYCANDDCDDNNASLPAAPNSSCDDYNSNTINDVILADGCTCLGTPDGGGGDGLDLAISVNGNGDDVQIYSQFSVTTTVTNEGTMTGTNVVVNIPQPAGLVFSGGNPYSATQGAYNYYSTYNWDVGTLAPGQSATITLNYFSIAGGPYTIYAQINAADGNDIDSTPNNGTPPNPNEDDEGVYTTGNGNPNPSCTLSLNASVSNIQCNDGGTDDVTGDDTFTFDLNVTSTGLWGWLGGGSTGAYGEVITFGPYLISNGDISFVVEDADNATCTANVNVSAPEPCSEGTPPPPSGCDDIGISVGNGTINITGLNNAPLTAVWIFDLDNGWQTVFSCNYGCNPSETITGLSGNYLVKVKKLNPNWSEICTVEENVTVGGGNPTGVLTLLNPGNSTMFAAPGENGIAFSYLAPLASTTCPGGVVNLIQTGGLGSGSYFPIGTTTETYLATDDCGNTETVSFTITVMASSSMINLTTPNNITVNANPGGNMAVVYFTAPIATTTCAAGGLSVVQTSGPASGSNFSAGTTAITYQATDACGNSAMVSFTVTVNSTASFLTITCPSSVTVDAAPGASSAVVNYENPSINSNCTSGPSGLYYELTDGVVSGGTFPVGTTIVEYTGYNGCNNPETCSFTVTVNMVVDPNPVGCDLDVLFVVGNTTLGSGDAAIKDRLEMNGYNVMIMDDNGIQTSAANGKDLVIISSTVLSSNVNTKFKTVAVPVLTWEGYLFDDMMLTGTSSSSYGSHWGTSQYVVANSSHPINAGFSGTVNVFNSDQDVTWGYPYSVSNDMGYIPGYPNRCLIISYDTGDNMFGLNAPARRVGFFLQNNTATQLNANGWRLFDQTVEWTTDCYNNFSEDDANEYITDREGELENVSERNGEEEELTKTISFAIYPNPATSFVNINVAGAENAPVQINIYDQLGRIIEYIELDNADSAYRLDTKDFNSGLYLISVQSNNEERVTKQLVIMPH